MNRPPVLALTSPVVGGSDCFYRTDLGPRCDFFVGSCRGEREDGNLVRFRRTHGVVTRKSRVRELGENSQEVLGRAHDIGDTRCAEDAHLDSEGKETSDP